MPTKRTLRTRGHAPVPEWVRRFRETGEEPEEGTEAREQFDAWYLLAGTEVPGLPLYEDWRAGYDVDGEVRRR